MLKNILSLLLSKFYSKKESGEVAHQAMPSTANVNIPSDSANSINVTLNTTESNGWARYAYYTAPCDGYLHFQGRSNGENGYLQCGAIWGRFGSGVTSRGFMPLAKGHVASLSGSDMKEVAAVFVKSIGGGYQLLRNFFCKEVAYVA